MFMMRELTQKEKAIAEQEHAIDRIKNFLEADVKEIGLFGVAGTGKTHCLIKVLEHVYKTYRNMRVLCMANSHSAVGVMMNRLSDSSFYNKVKFGTIASSLKLSRIVTDEGKIKYDRDQNEDISKIPVRNSDIIIVDECSQVSKDIRDKILRYKTSSAIVIYLGDHHQTPYIRDEDDDSGSILDTTNLEDSPCFSIKHKVYLKTPYRYEGDIHKAATALADEIDKDEPSLNVITNIYRELKSSNEVVFYTEKNVFTDDVVKFFKSNSDDSGCLINYRNATVDSDNRYIKHLVTGNEKYMVGDIIVCKRTNNDSLNKVINHRLYKIVGVEDYNREVIVTTKSLLQQEVKLVIECYILSLVDLDKREDVLTTIILKDNKDSNYLLVKQQLIDSATKEIDTNKKRLAWIEYYKFIESFGLFEPAYAVNTYTVQGGTYDEVFVNARDICSIQPISTRAKLQSLYTAFTRARKKVNILA